MDIRAERTRSMLKGALEELLEEKPIEDISVSELCGRSTVRRATFYRHFDDKYAFIEWYLTTLTDRFLEEIGVPAEDMGLREYVETMHRKLIVFLGEHRSWFMRTMGRGAVAGSLDMIMGEIAVGVAAKVAEEVEAGRVDSAVDSEFVSLFYAGGMVHTLRRWMLTGEPFPTDKIVAESTEFLMRYLGQ
ncbi:MAG: TetR family transcriptional regulator [Eggerthellaceae bacterium]|nr:TetR family transcriptional regulator [Eggerthellaceae bacterium]